MGHSQNKRKIRSRSNRNPLVCERNGVVQTRVNQHDVGSLFMGFFKRMQRTRPDCVGIAAPDEHGHSGVLYVACVIACSNDLGEPRVF